MASRPKLDGLPEELISNIAARLGSDDIFSLRLTCRTVDAGCLHEFATEYFTAKSFLFTTQSFKCLQGIADSDRLRNHLHDVSFCAAYFSGPVWKCPNACTSYQQTTRESEAHRDYYNDQQMLIKTGRDRNYIVEAFRMLPALTSLSVIDEYKMVDPVVDIRGDRSIFRRTGRHPLMAPSDGSSPKNKAYLNFLSHIWRTMIKAVAESGINTLHILETNLKCKREGLFAKDFQYSKEERQKLQKAFINVKHLRLYIKGRVLSPDKSVKGTESATIMKNFGSLFKNLTHFEYGSDGEKSSGALASAIMFPFNHSEIQLLRLHNVNCKGSFLKHVLTTLKNAKTVELSWIDLTEGSWLPILKVLQSMKHLCHLHLMYCQEAGQKAYFLTQPDFDRDPDEYDEDYDDEAEDSEDEADMPDLIDPETGEPSGNPVGQLLADAMPLSSTVADPVPEIQPDHRFSPFPEISEAEKWALDPNPAHKGIPLHSAPGCEDSGEIGYYVCIGGEKEIQRQLAVFVKEYNVGPTTDDPFAAAAAVGLFGPPPPMPGGGGATGGTVNVPGGAADLSGLLNLAGTFMSGPPPHAPPQPATPATHTANTNGANANGANSTVGATSMLHQASAQDGGHHNTTLAAQAAANAGTNGHTGTATNAATTSQPPIGSSGTNNAAASNPPNSFPISWTPGGGGVAHLDGTGNTLGLGGGGVSLAHQDYGSGNGSANIASASAATGGDQLPAGGQQATVVDDWEDDDGEDYEDENGELITVPAECAPQ